MMKEFNRQLKWILSDQTEREYYLWDQETFICPEGEKKKKKPGTIYQEGGNLRLSNCQNVLIAL